MPKPGDVVLTRVQFTDTFEVKKKTLFHLSEEKKKMVFDELISKLKYVS